MIPIRCIIHIISDDDDIVFWWRGIVNGIIDDDINGRPFDFFETNYYYSIPHSMTIINDSYSALFKLWWH